MFSSIHNRFGEVWKNVLGPTLGTVAIFLVEIAQVVLISLAIILPVRAFLIQPFVVRGASMEPNFYDNEYLIIDELSYRFREPVRGEIVVFKYPSDPSQYFIKRVIGLPGETVEISENTVTIFSDEEPLGVKLEEEYLGDVTTLGKKRVELKGDEYYLLGDNRDYSLDSRKFGPVARDYIVGRVWVRGFPFSRIDTFPAPIYSL